jgi:hypothetical protein
MSNDTFKINLKNSGETEFFLKQLGSSEIREADIIRAKHYAIALKEGMMLSQSAREYFKKQGLWNEEKEAELNGAEKELQELNYVLTKKRNLPLGNVGDKSMATMFGVARRMQELRGKIINLKTVFAGIAANTVEGFAENARSNYLLYARTVYIKDGKRYFKSFQHFLDSYDSAEGVDDSIVAKMAFTQYQIELFGSYEEDLNALPENQFLKRFKFINEDGRLIDKDGNLVDEQGRKVDKEGFLIDENGNYLDVNNRPLDKNGEYIEEPKPFLDNDGNPIIDDSYQAELELYKKSLEATKTPE